MAVSGTYNFNLDIDEIIQEAMEMIGGEQTLGHESASARRSINLMLNDWQNRGILLWSTDTTTVTVASDTTTYDLASSALDALIVTYQPNTSSAETKLERKSFEEYNIIPNKYATGRPTQYTVKRNLANPTIHLYPVPDNSTGLLQVELIRQVQDVNKSFEQNADAPVRFLPCLTAGLAYNMSLKRPGTAIDRIALLKANYEELLLRAMEEDKERASIYFKPKLRAV
jgi:hypothetical protein|tara:strand:+ start:22 stop:702 length:681 start_codon:yes stop_codon:yes gene_type:complete